MEKEFVSQSVVNPEFAEHSKPSRSKKVIEGPMMVPVDEALSANKKPVVGAVSGTASQILLTQGKAYRLIASTNTYIRFAKGGAAAADNTDIFLPANTYVTVLASYWDRINFVQATGAGIIQAIEVE